MTTTFVTFLRTFSERLEETALVVFLLTDLLIMSLFAVSVSREYFMGQQNAGEPVQSEELSAAKPLPLISNI